MAQLGTSAVLVVNESSGSNDPGSIDDVRNWLDHAGCTARREICFPQDDVLSGNELDAGGHDTLVIFTGDGSIHAAIEAVDGWSGQVLVLPGGTMNLLSKRLHGDCEVHEIFARIGQGQVRRTRPSLIETPCGVGLSGALTGPGTAWNEVREAMRGADITEMATGTIKALGESVDGAMVRIIDPALGRREGYPLVLLSPEEGGIDVRAFHAETAGEYIKQALALIRRDFRNGPHDRLGMVNELALEQNGEDELAMLVDGEPFTAPAPVRFRLGKAAVDLLSTLP